MCKMARAFYNVIRYSKTRFSADITGTEMPSYCQLDTALSRLNKKLHLVELSRGVCICNGNSTLQLCSLKSRSV